MKSTSMGRVCKKYLNGQAVVKKYLNGQGVLKVPQWAGCSKKYLNGQTVVISAIKSTIKLGGEDVVVYWH